LKKINIDASKHEINPANRQEGSTNKDILDRIEVPGGWLVRNVIYNTYTNSLSSSICFVPDKTGAWKA